jgi:hypothetical protein
MMLIVSSHGIYIQTLMSQPDLYTTKSVVEAVATKNTKRKNVGLTEQTGVLRNQKGNTKDRCEGLQPKPIHVLAVGFYPYGPESDQQSDHPYNLPAYIADSADHRVISVDPSYGATETRGNVKYINSNIEVFLDQYTTAYVNVFKYIFFDYSVWKFIVKKGSRSRAIDQLLRLLVVGGILYIPSLESTPGGLIRVVNVVDIGGNYHLQNTTDNNAAYTRVMNDIDMSMFGEIAVNAYFPLDPGVKPVALETLFPRVSEKKQKRKQLFYTHMAQQRVVVSKHHTREFPWRKAHSANKKGEVWLLYRY